MSLDKIQKLKHILPWLIVVMGIISLFFFSVKEVFNPLILFILSIYLLHPHIKNYGIRQLFIIILGLFLLWFLFQTSKILTPFIVGAVLAYLFAPIVDKLEGKKVKRPLGIILIIVPILTLIILILLLLVPYLVEQLYMLLKETPEYLSTVIEKAKVFLEGIGEKWNLPIDQTLDNFKQSILDGGNKFLKQLPANLITFGKGVGAVLAVISYLVITPVMVFYILKDWKKIKQGIKKLIPLKHYDDTIETFRQIDNLIGKYIRGQITVATIIGIITWLGLWISGIEFAFVLGVITGIFNVVPYVGVIISIVPALIVAIATSNSILWAILKILIVFTIANQLETVVISPRVMSKEVGLPPLVIMLSILICGYFFKFVGLLIAVPLAGIITYLIGRWRQAYFSSEFFKSTEHAED